MTIHTGLLMKTHDLPRQTFWGLLKPVQKSAPRTWVTTTREIDYPYRVSDAKVYRVGKRGILIGKWRPREQDVHTHLLETMAGRDYPLERILNGN